MISGVILTKNEEKNISQAIKSLKWCSEIIVVDDYSTDKTIKIAKKLGAKVYLHKSQEDFSGQRNFGLRQAKGEWVLFVDADEVVTKRLKQEISSSVQQVHKVNGFYLKRKDKFMGRWLKHGETNKVKLLRLARKDSGKWQGKVHEVWQIKGKILTLTNPLIHKREINVSQFIKRIDEYSSLRAEELYHKGVRTNIIAIIAYPLGKFWQNYILRLGFLDCMPGFIIGTMMSWHSFLVRAKLYLLWKKEKKNRTNLFSWLFIFWTGIILVLYLRQLLQRGRVL